MNSEEKHITAEAHNAGLCGQAKTVDSTSDERTVNNVVRHEYRVLTDSEKAQVNAIKDKGAELISLIQKTPLKHQHGPASAELVQAQIKVEEAVFWAVKHITA